MREKLKIVYWLLVPNFFPICRTWLYSIVDRHGKEHITKSSCLPCLPSLDILVQAHFPCGSWHMALLQGSEMCLRRKKKKQQKKIPHIFKEMLIKQRSLLNSCSGLMKVSGFYTTYFKGISSYKKNSDLFQNHCYLPTFILWDFCQSIHEKWHISKKKKKKEWLHLANGLWIHNPNFTEMLTIVLTTGYKINCATEARKLTSKKLSTYCNTYTPQSLKLFCWGTFGLEPFMTSLEKLLLLPFLTSHSTSKYLRKKAYRKRVRTFFLVEFCKYLLKFWKRGLELTPLVFLQHWIEKGLSMSP